MPTIVERPEIAEPNWQALDALMSQTIAWLNTEDGIHRVPGHHVAIRSVLELSQILLAGDLGEEDMMEAFSSRCKTAAFWLLEFYSHDWSAREDMVRIAGEYRG